MLFLFKSQCSAQKCTVFRNLSRRRVPQTHRFGKFGKNDQKKHNDNSGPRASQLFFPTPNRHKLGLSKTHFPSRLLCVQEAKLLPVGVHAVAAELTAALTRNLR